MMIAAHTHSLRAYTSDVGDPELAWATGNELAIQQISRLFDLCFRSGGPRGTWPAGPLEAFGSHEAFDSAAGNPVTSATRLSPRPPASRTECAEGGLVLAVQSDA